MAATAPCLLHGCKVTAACACVATYSQDLRTQRIHFCKLVSFKYASHMCIEEGERKCEQVKNLSELYYIHTSISSIFFRAASININNTLPANVPFNEKRHLGVRLVVLYDTVYVSTCLHFSQSVRTHVPGWSLRTYVHH
ncbi:hypothetical protein PUN28_012896 [Cardiocondyla obscurior]|uniref:Secreted protein n=1 Tax=Cardiocondyla obscurior TaxID=286306 RepID=A0AAW2FBF6_9HYME